jgi:precorrin-2 methylase
MLVNYKNANILTAEMGTGKPKLVLVPGINVLEDAVWEAAEKTLAEHIKRGLIVPIYKVSKKDGKDVKSPVTPDEIPNEQIDEVVDAIASEAQADKFVKASTKESVRAKAMNRKDAIKKEIEKKTA